MNTVKRHLITFALLFAVIIARAGATIDEFQLFK
jgi:hypothetical protein